MKPIIKLKNKTIKVCKEALCRGVLIGRKLTFLPHIQRATRKAVYTMQHLLTLANGECIVPPRRYMTYYRVICEAICLYTVNVFSAIAQTHYSKPHVLKFRILNMYI